MTRVLEDFISGCNTSYCKVHVEDRFLQQYRRFCNWDTSDQSKTIVLDKVSDWSAHIQCISTTYWKPSSNIHIDEAIVLFCIIVEVNLLSILQASRYRSGIKSGWRPTQATSLGGRSIPKSLGQLSTRHPNTRIWRQLKALSQTFSIGYLDRRLLDMASRTMPLCFY